MAKFHFEFNQRLGIELPTLTNAWENLTTTEQQKILYRWEQIRSQIPERIKELEAEIQQRELQLQIEDNFQTFCQLSAEISELASKVIDLNLWFRTHEEISVEEN